MAMTAPLAMTMMGSHMAMTKPMSCSMMTKVMLRSVLARRMLLEMLRRRVRLTPAPGSSRRTMRGIGHEGAAKLQELLLAAGEVAGVFVGEVGEGEHF